MVSADWLQPLDPALFVEAYSAALERRREGGKALDLEDNFFAVIGRLKGLEPSQAVAIMFRLKALAFVVHERSADSWVLRTGAVDHVLIATAVIRAAATARLVEVGREVRFDLDDLLATALGEADQQGSA